MSISVYESLHYKLETGSIEPDAEIDDSEVDNKMIEVGSDISLSEVGEMVNLFDKRDLNVEELHDNMEPYVGMEFESEEAAMMYYDAYAKRVGFIIRLGSCHRSSRDGSVINRRFLCNKEGFRVNKKVKRLEVRKPREVTREGCKAMIMIRKEISGKWIVAKVETEHTHPLGLPPRKVRHGSIPIRSQRSLNHPVAFTASILADGITSFQPLGIMSMTRTREFASYLLNFSTPNDN